MTNSRDRRLMAHGFLIFALAIWVGLLAHWMANPRMGLAAHLEGLLNGMMLVLLGLVWKRLALGPRALTTTAWMLVIGSYTTLIMHVLAAVWPGGDFWMPIAAGGRNGAFWLETLVTTGVVIIGATLIPGSALVVLGLWRREERGASATTQS